VSEVGQTVADRKFEMSEHVNEQSSVHTAPCRTRRARQDSVVVSGGVNWA